MRLTLAQSPYNQLLEDKRVRQSRASRTRVFQSGRECCAEIELIQPRVFIGIQGLSMPMAGPVSTYSIIAIDREREEMGVAVQSHWFSVGSVVTWAEPGVGVVATQSFVELSYGPLGLKFMGRGKSPRVALRTLLSSDKEPEVRQVAMLDSRGRVAVHTGSRCLPEAGGSTGDGYSAQANLMSTRAVWPSMASAFRNARGPLSHRLMAALEAGEEAGGDRRGRQSAAMLIVKSRRVRPTWKGRVLELRVEDNPEPLKELRRLLTVHEAYEHANRGDELMAEGRKEEANLEYSEAARKAPKNEELKFWHAVTLLNQGREGQAAPLLKEVFAGRNDWKDLLSLLPRYGLLKINRERLGKLLR